jgi:alkylated DNA nucleotide flippase Atl1
MTTDEYVDEVLALVERIPAGRVMSYGGIADYLAERSGRLSPRLIGRIMALYGGAVPWHRVVSSSGRVVARHTAEAIARLRAERTPLRNGHVDMPLAEWQPD